MSDVSRMVVPDKGSLNREQLVTNALKFPSCTIKKYFHLNWNGVLPPLNFQHRDHCMGGQNFLTDEMLLKL